MAYKPRKQTADNQENVQADEKKEPPTKKNLTMRGNDPNGAKPNDLYREFGCLDCGNILYVGPVRVVNGMFRVLPQELKSCDDNVVGVRSSNQRPACPYCDKPIDLCIK